MDLSPAVRVGRVYETPAEADGVRVLVDRLWPHGLAKDAAKLDEWCQEVAPSPGLRMWYGHQPERYAEFARRYRAELEDAEHAPIVTRLRELAAQRTVTLLTASRHLELSHATVLAQVLTGSGGQD